MGNALSCGEVCSPRPQAMSSKNGDRDYSRSDAGSIRKIERDDPADTSSSAMFPLFFHSSPTAHSLPVLRSVHNAGLGSEATELVSSQAQQYTPGGVTKLSFASESSPSRSPRHKQASVQFARSMPTARSIPPRSSRINSTYAVQESQDETDAQTASTSPSISPSISGKAAKANQSPRQSWLKKPDDFFTSKAKAHYKRSSHDADEVLSVGQQGRAHAQQERVEHVDVTRFTSTSQARDSRLRENSNIQSIEVDRQVSLSMPTVSPPKTTNMDAESDMDTHQNRLLLIAFYRKYRFLIFGDRHQPH
eukprot:CAMPEP_0173057878 /NCGR_PEP_ID=MMETSP1102-20130122/1021_1 /TAXON_ID=49646 /ORGANISM="Geminigera sp., Strain Caron Lab Isolate" /LENGTH=305 /DNA_ID=CAMNT_0013923515 /DNA_START=43 /DNA_END=960 /DNA_ORIENTATION=-